MSASRERREREEKDSLLPREKAPKSEKFTKLATRITATLAGLFLPLGAGRAARDAINEHANNPQPPASAVRKYGST